MSDIAANWGVTNPRIARHGDGWRPIDTAPHDGTLILTWVLHKGPMIAYWGRTSAINRPAWIGGHCQVDHINQPTCWMPLPDPPVEAEVTQ